MTNDHVQISLEPDIISSSNLTRNQNVMEKVASRAIDAICCYPKMPLVSPGGVMHLHKSDDLIRYIISDNLEWISYSCQP